ncbi:helix-turn-helix domain-containing protein [Sphingobium sp. YBL2]|uniref:helix-turn-helix domain-containing protein n=1 Tax=Sphingobium sp. (strain YBL2) TaxID=484429 RepID=UPI000A0111A8|nr:helix-turn-helix transcriptional regulator [Sphingobium sp. YBL2]
MSYRTGVNGRRRAAARFVAKTHRLVQKAYEKRRKEGLTQTALAVELDVHRSVVNRQLNGREDISVARVAEYAYLLGYDIDMDFREKTAGVGTNHSPIVPPVFRTVSSPSNPPISAKGEPGKGQTSTGAQVSFGMLGKSDVRVSVVG